MGKYNNGSRSKCTERSLKMVSDGHSRKFGPYASSGYLFYNNVMTKNCIVDYEQ